MHSRHQHPSFHQHPCVHTRFHSAHWSLPNLSPTSSVSREVPPSRNHQFPPSPQRDTCPSTWPIPSHTFILFPRITRRPGNGLSKPLTLLMENTPLITWKTDWNQSFGKWLFSGDTIHTTDLSPWCQTSASSIITWPVGLQCPVLIPRGQFQVKFSTLTKFYTRSGTGGHICAHQLSSKRGDLEPLNTTHAKATWIHRGKVKLQQV